MKKYSFRKGAKKAMWPTIWAIGALVVGSYESIIPKEILTPVVVVVFEIARNFLKIKKEQKVDLPK